MEQSKCLEMSNPISNTLCRFLTFYQLGCFINWIFFSLLQFCFENRGAFRLTDVEAMATTSQIVEIEDQQKTISPDSGYNIQFTSGTTGLPKAALLKHFAIVNSGISFGNLIGLLNTKICAQVPFFHIFGVLATLMASLSLHATAVLPSIAYNPDKSLIAIKDEECQIIYGTPTMYVDLVSKQREKNFDLKVKTAVTGGALCPAQLVKDMKNVLKLERVHVSLISNF